MQSSELVIEFALDKRENVKNRHHANWALQIVRWYLKLLGIWQLPTMSSSYFGNVSTSVIIIFYSLLLMFIVLPGFLFIYKQADDPYVAIKMLGGMGYCIMAMMKYFSLVSRRRCIAECIKHVIIDWEENILIDDQIIMIHCARYGRLGSIICGVCMFCGGIFYSGILPVVTPNFTNENNITIKPIAYQSYYIWFNEQSTIAYKIVYFTQIFCTLLMNSITSVSCIIAVVFAMHACGQLRILCRLLNEFMSITKRRQEFDKFFPEIIPRHTRALRFISNIGEILNGVCLVEIVGCTLVICLLEYYILLGWREDDVIGLMTFSTLLISLVFNVFLFCYIGNLITTECQEVGNVTYMSNWNGFRVKNIRHIALIMLIAQNPKTISAGGMSNLSLITFATVLRTSVAYFNLLRKVTT